VRFLGNQDTLLLNNYRSCCTGVFTASSIYEKRSCGGPITANKTDAGVTYGFLFCKGTITGAGATTNSNRPQMSDATAAGYTPQKCLARTDGWSPHAG
jgi:hypothetical protein